MPCFRLYRRMSTPPFEPKMADNILSFFSVGRKITYGCNCSVM